jgi:hypothetical protein
MVSRSTIHPVDDVAVARIEVGLLSLIFALHPKHLTADELIHRAKSGDPQGKERNYERALSRLKDTELICEANGLIAPTPAALHFDELPF